MKIKNKYYFNFYILAKYPLKRLDEAEFMFREEVSQQNKVSQQDADTTDRKKQFKLKMKQM